MKISPTRFEISPQATPFNHTSSLFETPGGTFEPLELQSSPHQTLSTPE